MSFLQKLFAKKPVVPPTHDQLTEIWSHKTDAEMVQVLAELCQDYMRWSNKNHYRVDELEPIATVIGEIINQRGGIEEMRRIHAMLHNIPGSRTLEMHWNGIGSWRG